VSVAASTINANEFFIGAIPYGGVILRGCEFFFHDGLDLVCGKEHSVIPCALC
jgi:hypothetical protein